MAYFECDPWYLSDEGPQTHTGPLLAASDGGHHAVTPWAKSPVTALYGAVVHPEHRVGDPDEPTRAYHFRASTTSGLVAEAMSSISLENVVVRQAIS